MDVTPDKENIEKLFSNTVYYIDFYQRQYKWDRIPVIRLLDDVFYKFNEEHKHYKDSDIAPAQIINKYAWYYLNTYVTNLDPDSGHLYVVDGQQRLTTLTLILIKLYHMAETYQPKLQNWISDRIVGCSGYDQTFWINHDLHEPTLRALYEGAPNVPTDTGITAVNMANNYNTISDRLDKELTDAKTFERFVFYFLRRLVIINLKVEQTDVPMVFEVINDRGVRLRPYEILKGKLLGQVDKEELEALKLNELWDTQTNVINRNNPEEFDHFFTYYLKAKFANTTGGSKIFDRDYHRAMFSSTTLGLDHNPCQVKKFLLEDFRYYSNLYERLLNYRDNYDPEFKSVYYNGLTDRGQQFMLILSACRCNDPQEELKIKTVAFELDRLFCLLQLQRCYDSNKFNEVMYRINANIRNQNLEDIKNVFRSTLIELLRETLNNGEINTPFSYGYFRETGMELEKRFKRYIFARIEEFIADSTNMNMRHNIYDLVVNTGSRNGFHIEHILAENEENHRLFNDDEELFRSQRNRLGGLLLLKGKDNISSNNESYSDKLKSYANTLYWNETLRSDTYKSKMDFRKMIEQYNLKLRPMEQFGPKELEERHQLLFDIISIIWETER